MARFFHMNVRAPTVYLAQHILISDQVRYVVNPQGNEARSQWNVIAIIQLLHLEL